MYRRLVMDDTIRQAWTLIKPNVIPISRAAQVPKGVRAWMGLLVDTGERVERTNTHLQHPEFRSPSYQRISVDVLRTIEPNIYELEGTFGDTGGTGESLVGIALWKEPEHGEPFYAKEFERITAAAGFTLTIKMRITDVPESPASWRPLLRSVGIL